MKPFCSTVLAAALLCGLAAGDLSAQKKNKKPGSDDDGYIPVVAPETDKKKKKDQEVTQTLPAAPEPPLALTIEADRLTFAVSPLSAKGLLSQQTRDALNALLHRNHGTIVKLRAFVAGSGDLRRVGELAGEIFAEKHEPLPVISVVQVGALPLAGAQVVIESVEADRKVVNPEGVVFFSGQPADSVAKSLERLHNLLDVAHLPTANVLRATCFVSSLEEQRDTARLLTTAFPNATVSYVQMQREPVTPAADCEAVGRRPPPFGTQSASSEASSYVAIEPGSKLVITGTQLAFGAEENDLKLAFDRLEKALSASNTSLDHATMLHLYATSPAMAERIWTVLRARHASGSSTMLPVEGLPSLDARFGVDVVALAER